MTRRKKPSGLERQELKSESFLRPLDKIPKVASVMIASEDSVSSVEYFKLILNDLKKSKKITPFSCVFAKHRNTHPTGVLNDLLTHTEKNGSTYKDFEYSWIVIDRDKQWTHGSGHEKDDFNQALKDATKANIKVAYSNDSFELWYLLHFDYVCDSMTRDEVNKRVKDLNLFDNADSLKSKKFVHAIYPCLIGEPERKAIKHAERLLEMHIKDSVEPSDANPSTTVHELVDFLRKLS